VLEGGEKFAFPTGLLCKNKVVRVGGWVPRPGHTISAQVVGPEWTASMKMHRRTDGDAIVRCF
jgi:hypothetical protein